MSEPLGEAAALDRENLLATRAAPRRVRRYEGQRGDVAVEGLGPQTLGDLQFDDRRFGRGLLRAEGRRAAPLGFEPFDVHVGYDKLLLRGETFAFAQNGAVLGDQGIACEYQIGRRFARAGRTVDVGRERAGRLLGHERAQVVVLACRFGRSREVEDRRRTGERQLRRRRCGDPQIFADLHAELGAVHREGEVAAEVGFPAGEHDRVRCDLGAR